MADKQIRIGIDFKATGTAQAASEVKRMAQATREATNGSATGAGWSAQSPISQFGREAYQSQAGLSGPNAAGEATLARLKADIAARNQAEAAKAAIKSEALAVKQERGTARIDQRTQAFTGRLIAAGFAVGSLNDALGSLDPKTRTAVAGINSAALALSSLGMGIGGKTGNTMMAAGMAGTIASAVGSAVAAVVQTYSDAQTARQDAINKMGTIESMRSQADKYEKEARLHRWSARNSGMNAGQAESEFQKGEDADKQAGRLRTAADRREKYDTTMDAARAARARSRELRNANLTPDERIRKDVAELQAGSKVAADASKLLREMKKDDPRHARQYEEEALRMDREQLDLQQRANERLSDIGKDLRTWPEMAMDSIGGGPRGSRALTLGEMQASFNPNYNLSFINSANKHPSELVKLLQSAGMVRLH